jgi:microcin C transport system permease protein
MTWTLIKVALLLAGATFVTTCVIPWTFVRVGRRLGFKMQFGPTTAKRVARFKRIRRGYWAFLGMCTLLLLCLFLELLINNKPLAIRYGDRLSFPAVKDWVGKVLFFVPISSFCKKEDYGQSGQSEVDYRAFARTCRDPEARIREIREVIETAKLEYVKDDPPPAADAPESRKRTWQARFDRTFAKRAKEFQAIEKDLEVFRSGRAWIVLTLYPYGPQETRLDFPGENPPNKPSIAQGIPLGTDLAGRDIFVHMAYGFRTAMALALIVVFVGTIFGILVGGMQGYYGGWIDIISQRVVEIWSSIPFLYVILIVAALMTPTFWLLVVLMTVLSSWLRITYYVRGEFYREKAKDYVQAAIGMGVPDWKIIVRHMLPNSMVPIVTFTPFAIVGYISALVSLDYLNFGLPPPSWGVLLRQGLDNVKFHPHLIIVPTVALSVTLYAIVLVGEAVREAFDPKVFSRLR